MCGISLIAEWGGNPIDLSLIKRMNDIIHYRGPDDEGFACWGVFRGEGVLPLRKSILEPKPEQKIGVALGHRRLSILDLSEAGHQPMRSLGGRYWIVYNGEVYNYLELRDELRGMGYHFSNDTDTQVILTAFEAWGVEAFNRFNGMWAFVIYDTVKQTITASRDRFGVKPFYYALSGNRIAISSEIKQLRAAGFGSGCADRFQVAQFLQFGSVNIARQTFFKGINQLLPAEALSLDLKSGSDSLRVWHYYRSEINFSMAADGRLAEYQESFKQVFQNAVNIRLRSDVPVGSCLSGGLDSSAIVSMVSWILQQKGGNKNQKTFTSCFKDRRYDEWNFAQMVVDSAKTTSHQIWTEMDKIWEEMDTLTWHQEEPFRSTSIYAQWNVMRLAKKSGVTVLLDGQGSDEISAGYHYYLPAFFVSLFRAFQWKSMLKEYIRLMHTGVLESSYSKKRFPFMLVCHAFRLGNLRRRLRQKKNSFLKEQYMLPSEYASPVGFQHYVQSEITGTLQSLLRHEDRNSMAFSLESRTPFLDYRLVELFLKMPGIYKIRDGWTKPFLREATAGFLPDQVRYRVDKKGFTTPEIPWYQANVDHIKKTLLNPDSPLQIWLDQDKLALWLDHSLHRPQDFRVWWLLSLNCWMKTFKLS